MRKIKCYHGLREGSLHIVKAAEATFYEPGEMPRNIFDVHPPVDELKKRSKDEGRPELEPNRKVTL